MTALTNDAPSTLADLVSPLTEAEFMELLRRRVLVYRPGANGDRYAPLLGWPALRRMIAAGDYPDKRPDDIRVVKDSVVAPAERWTTDGKIDLTKLDEFLAAGFSVVILHLDEHIPALAKVCNEIRTRTLEGSYVGTVVTSGTGAGAFRMHYDFEDLVILQVEGTKRWQIFGPPVSHPVRRMPKQLPPDGTEPTFDEVLEAGDLLFVPGGNWHRCESGLSTSVHIGIFFLPPTGWHAVNQATRQLLGEELFRTPLSRFENTDAFAVIEAEIKSRLIEKIGELKLDAFVREWSKMAY
ncbi:MAG: cupin domain-containing protein [Alphaproteobacteria bacterium]